MFSIFINTAFISKSPVFSKHKIQNAVTHEPPHLKLKKRHSLPSLRLSAKQRHRASTTGSVYQKSIFAPETRSPEL